MSWSGSTSSTTTTTTPALSYWQVGNSSNIGSSSSNSEAEGTVLPHPLGQTLHYCVVLCAESGQPKEPLEKQFLARELNIPLSVDSTDKDV